MKRLLAHAPLATLCATLAAACSLNPIGEDPGISNDSEPRGQVSEDGFESPETESPIADPAPQDEATPSPTAGGPDVDPITQPMNGGELIGDEEPSPVGQPAPGVDTPASGAPPPAPAEPDPSDVVSGAGGAAVAPGNMVIEAGVPDGGPLTEDDDGGPEADAGAPDAGSP